MPNLQWGPLWKRLQNENQRVKPLGSEPVARTSELDTPAAPIDQIITLSALSPKPQRLPKTTEVYLHQNDVNMETSEHEESMDEVDQKFRTFHEILDTKLNELRDELPSEEILHFQTSNGREDTLLVNVIIKGDVDHDVLAFVDSGATFSLINEKIYNKLNPALFPLRPSSYKRVRGIGNVTFPVIGETTIPLLFPPSFQIPPSNFVIIPAEVTDHSLVIGYDILRRDHLLPDAFSGELVRRKGNLVMPLARDLRDSQGENKWSCSLLNDVNIPPFSFATIFLKTIYNESNDEGLLFEPFPNSSLIIDPSMISINKLNFPVIANNPNSHHLKLKKNLRIGELTSNPSVAFQISELQTHTREEYPEWTKTSLSEAFSLQDSDITMHEVDRVLELLLKYASIISRGDSDVGCTNVMKHAITLFDDAPVQVPVRRLQGPILQEVEDCCQALEQDGIIRKSKSPFSAPVVPIRKPDGTIRLCIDYRSLNKNTKTDTFLIPNLIDMLFNLQGKKYFTTIDLVKGYYQVEMEEDSIEKTAFTTPLSHWEFLRMPFGLKNAPAKFQRGMRYTLSHIPWTETMVYLDDILVLSDTVDDHLRNLENVLIALDTAGFKIKPQKTYILRKEVKYLGHLISASGMKPLSTNLQGIQDFPIPTTVRKVRQFLGMVNFYRRHIPNCSQIAKPLSNLTSKNIKKIIFTQECREAFEALKNSLINPPLLSYPHREQGAGPMIIHVDASNSGAGACLSQKQIDEVRPIAFISTLFNKAEQRYSTTEKEVAAIRWAVKSLKPFLYGIKVILYSDHLPLMYLNNMSLLNQRVARTLEEINDIDYELRYIPGKDNIIADALSRSLEAKEDKTPTEIKSIIPSGTSEVKIPGGGDSLFQCLSLFLHGNQDEHLKIREQVMIYLQENRKLYNIPTGRSQVEITRYLNLLKKPGQMPPPLAIEAFADINKVQVWVYYDGNTLLKYGPEDSKNICNCCALQECITIFYSKYLWL